MSYSRHATTADQPAGYRAVRLAAPGATIVHPVEKFEDDFPANRAQRWAGDWLGEEQAGLAVLEDTIRTPPRSGNGGHFRPRFASICRCGGAACNLYKMEEALRGTFLHIRSSNESTIHPASGLLVQALQDLVQSARHTNEHYSHLLHCCTSKLEEDAGMICPGENGGKYIFLLNNICGILQMMHRQGATFANEELMTKLNSLIHRYKKRYIDECWVPLTSTCCLNLDKFTAEFLAICDNQRTWKVTAQLRYELRQEIVDLIVPSYGLSLSALHANTSQLSGVLCSFKRVTAGKKKQKRYTGEELAQKIRGLFEG